MKAFLDRKFEFEHYSGKLALIESKIRRYEGSDCKDLKTKDMILANLKSEQFKLQEILKKFK